MKIKKLLCPRYFTLAITMLFVLLSSGCARYAPVLVATQTYKVMTIQLDMAANIPDDIYYYIAFDLSEDPQSEGPLPYLAGDRIAENWDYYIRYYNGQFTEKLILSEDNLYEEPDLFNALSTRFYQTTQTQNSMSIGIKLDPLKNGTYNIRMNFISSREPLQDSSTAVQVIDYLLSPRLTVSNTIGFIAYSAQYPTLAHTVTTEEDKGGDIVDWRVEVETL